MIRLKDLNQSGLDRFAAQLEGVFEHSPWIAEKAAARRPFSSVDDLFQAMTAIVQEADEKEKMALIQSHPRLGTRKKLTAESQAEQAQAGVSGLSGSGSERLDTLNRRYEAVFGFPFVMAVRGKTKSDILEELKTRLRQSKSKEFERALEEIYKIAKFRLEERVSP